MDGGLFLKEFITEFSDKELHLIKVLKENFAPVKTKLSDKYKGIISKEQGQNLNEHIKQMRSEWNNI